MNAAIKEAADRIQGKVKVTAFDYLAPAPLAPAGGTCDLLVFPAGISFRGLPLEQLPAAVLSALTGGAAAQEQQQQQQLQLQQAGEEVQGDTLFVCCHAARDERCGALGPPLAAKLAELLDHKGMGSSMWVLKTSHVGGHKVRQAGLDSGWGWGWAWAWVFPWQWQHCLMPRLPCTTLPAVRRQCAGLQPRQDHRRRLVWRAAHRQRRAVPGRPPGGQGTCLAGLRLGKGAGLNVQCITA